jgi:hypothetical protein
VGRLLIYLGALLLAAGVIVSLLERFSPHLHKLPGDIVWRGRHATFYFPIVTCLVLSLLASLVLWLLNRR